MKVLLTTHPGLGHLHPLVPLAQALQQAGHDVAFACSAALLPTIDRLGFKGFAAGLNWLESAAEKTFPELKATPLEQQPRDWLLTEVFADVAAHEMVPDLLRIAQEWQPDVLVRTELEFAGCIAAELLNLPHAALSVETFIPPFIWEQRIGEQLSYVRSAHGLPPYPATAMLHPYLYLACIAPSMLIPEFQLPAVAHQLQPLIFDQTNGALPEWVMYLPDQPTVYVSLGTVFNRSPYTFQSVIEGLRAEPINVIITLGAKKPTAYTENLPPNIHVAEYIPLSLILPHCDLAIASCGFQTTMSLISHGLPVIAIPVGSSNPFRAMRFDTLGMGIALRPDEQPLHEENHFFKQYLLNQQWPLVSEQTIRNAVRTILNTASYQENALQAKAEVDVLPGAERAVELLEQLVHTQQPIYA